MPYVLNYASAGNRVGRCIIAANSRDDALTRAQEVLQGMDCATAALQVAGQLSPSADDVVIASYTLGRGWVCLGDTGAVPLWPGR